MDVPPISDVCATNLTTDLVQRARKMAKIEHVSHREARQIEKVYNSKRQCLNDIQEKFQQLQDLVQRKKQKRKALLLKRSDEYLTSVDIIAKTKQLQAIKENLIKEEKIILQEYGKTLSEIDQKFLESVTNMKDDRVAENIKNLHNEIENIRKDINNLKEKSQTCLDDYTSPALDEILVNADTVQETYEKLMEEHEMLLEEQA